MGEGSLVVLGLKPARDACGSQTTGTRKKYKRMPPSIATLDRIQDGFLQQPSLLQHEQLFHVGRGLQHAQGVYRKRAKKNRAHGRILRELKKLRPKASHDVAQHDADAEKREKKDVGKKQGRTTTEPSVQTPEAKGEMADSYASDIKSIKDAVSDIAQRLSSLIDMTASQQREAACVNERRISDMSDGSIELLHTPDCVRP
jgi:hypothetical protein